MKRNIMKAKWRNHVERQEQGADTRQDGDDRREKE
jgi:hypothetical protein